MKKLLLIILVTILSVAFATVRDGERAMDSGDYQEAIKQFEAAIVLRDTNVKAFYQLAHAKTLLAGTLDDKAEKEKLYEEAAEAAKKAIALDDNEPKAHFELARALGRLGEYRGVLQSLGIAADMKRELDITLKLDPNYGAAYHALALWNLKVPWVAGGRAGQVESLFEKSIEVEPDSITHYADFAEVLIDRGKVDQAKEILEIALSLDANTKSMEDDKAFAQSLWDSIQ